MISRKQSLLKLEQALQIARASGNTRLALTLNEILLRENIRAPQVGGESFNNDLIQITRPLEPHTKAPIKKKAYKYIDNIVVDSKDEIETKWNKYKKIHNIHIDIYS